MNVMDGEHCYFFALEIEPMEVGAVYKTIPLHCTLLHRFFSNLPINVIDEKVRSVFEQTASLRLLPEQRLAFGPNRVLVATLKLSPALKNLHIALYGLLNELVVRYSETDWVGPGYKPHVTDQSGKSLSLDTTQVSNTVYLLEVEHPLQGRRKFVRRKFKLMVLSE